jgi:hypothetical protein
MSTAPPAIPPSKPIRIPVQPIAGAEPMMCLENVKKRIRAMGGRPAFGWAIRHDLYTDVKQNHCVWEDQTGQLWDVTPVFESVQGEFVVVVWPDDTEFEPDDTAAFEGRSLPNRYVPTHPSPHVATACTYMENADEFLRHGDLDRCRYWTERANREMKKARLPVRWESPASTELGDFVRSMLMPEQPTGGNGEEHLRPTWGEMQ